YPTWDGVEPRDAEEPKNRLAYLSMLIVTTSSKGRKSFFSLADKGNKSGHRTRSWSEIDWLFQLTGGRSV
ncbi:hypothetical protein ACFLXQ_08745, partial [Chloroflexota bacterium]